MEKMLLLVFSVSVSWSLHAQKIHFTDTSNVWKELEPQYNAPLPEILNYYSYSFIGDSTIDSQSYKVFSFGTGMYATISLVREDTVLKKVYIRADTGDSDLVLMDYNLNAGDSFITAYNHFVVTGIDSTLINAVWYRVWSFSPIAGGIYGSSAINVIEGIGCIQHPTYMLWDFTGCVECSQPFMYCFSNDDATPVLSPAVSFFSNNSTSCISFPTLYTGELQLSRDDVVIYPNPSAEELNITASKKITTVVINDIIGRTIYEHMYDSDQVQINIESLPSGMYFMTLNGLVVRKFIKQ